MADTKNFEHQMVPNESLIPENNDMTLSGPSMRPQSKRLEPEQQKAKLQRQQSIQKVIPIQSWRIQKLEARFTVTCLRLVYKHNPQAVQEAIKEETGNRPLNTYSLKERMSILKTVGKKLLRSAAAANGIDPNDLSHPANLIRLQNMMSNPDSIVGQNFAVLLGVEKAENDQGVATSAAQDQLTLQEQYSEEEDAENILHFNFTKAEEADIAAHTLPRLEPKPGAQVDDETLQEGEKEFTVDSAANEVIKHDEIRELELRAFKSYINHDKEGLMASFTGKEATKQAVEKVAMTAVKILTKGG